MQLDGFQYRAARRLKKITEWIKLRVAYIDFKTTTQTFLAHSLSLEVVS